jgi:HEPN domain-containing protein
VSLLLGNLPEIIAVPEDIIEAGKSLDKLYIPTRYPNGLEQEAPTDFYT